MEAINERINPMHAVSVDARQLLPPGNRPYFRRESQVSYSLS